MSELPTLYRLQGLVKEHSDQTNAKEYLFNVQGGYVVRGEQRKYILGFFVTDYGGQAWSCEIALADMERWCKDRGPTPSPRSQLLTWIEDALDKGKGVLHVEGNGVYIESEFSHIGSFKVPIRFPPHGVMHTHSPNRLQRDSFGLARSLLSQLLEAQMECDGLAAELERVRRVAEEEISSRDRVIHSLQAQCESYHQLLNVADGTKRPFFTSTSVPHTSPALKRLRDTSASLSTQDRPTYGTASEQPLPSQTQTHRPGHQGTRGPSSPTLPVVNFISTKASAGGFQHARRALLDALDEEPAKQGSLGVQGGEGVTREAVQGLEGVVGGDVVVSRDRNDGEVGGDGGEKEGEKKDVFTTLGPQVVQGHLVRGRGALRGRGAARGGRR